ncbi:circadian clock protein KaiC [Capsulimonas corticalis]|uniref:Circadian clock protein KaiC n=1 Tax=Capsulimonas corticalis TaxID=2219043 RepID=A0A402CW47_9BACT|nr:circadian clock protein KaiC [Capsulimonas corticalis]
MAVTQTSLANGARRIDRAASGIVGLDDVLGGGFPRNRLYLLQGDPGVGKTTLAMQFLLEGARRGERVLYVTLSESLEEIQDVVQSHGWSLDGVDIHEFSQEDQLSAQTQSTVFHPAELELGETMRTLLGIVERVQPSRVVFDSLSELRLLAADSLRYRREILSLKHYFVGRKSTVLLLDDRTTDAGDRQLQSLCHGVVALDNTVPEYGVERYRVRITKMRGVRFRGGYHDYVIRTGGLDVYPRLVAAEHKSEFINEPISSGVKALDDLLGGGLDRGASIALMGPSGCGKSTIATRYIVSAAQRGENAAMFLFEETPATLFQRSRLLHMDLKPYVDNGCVAIHSIDPAELAPNEFIQRVRDAVEKGGARIVLIDSLNGYLNAMPGERYLILQLHELLTYLSQQGVTTLLITAQAGMMAAAAVPGLDISYIADTALLFRYFEYGGAIKKALSVFKRRSGQHEQTIRELILGGEPGICISEPLTQFRGLLTGVPTLDRGGDTQKTGAFA